MRLEAMTLNPPRHDYDRSLCVILGACRRLTIVREQLWKELSQR